MCEFITSIFSALVAVWLAIAKYQREQRTLRLQKLYFEDTFLGQIKSMEIMMSQTNKNMLTIENLNNLIINIMNQTHIDINLVKTELIAAFDNAINNIKLDVFTTDFKKETMLKLLYDSGIKNFLPRWINRFEKDIHRFYFFLQSQTIILKTNVTKLVETNKSTFLKVSTDIYGEHVQMQYLLIERHYILFNLLSEIILIVSSENYENVKKILAAFRQEKIVKISNLVNEAFISVIAGDFESLDLGNISEENNKKLKEKMEEIKKKIAKTLYSTT